MTAANDLAAIAAQAMPNSQDYAGIEQYYQGYGDNIGKILRYATQFDPSLLPVQPTTN